MDCKTAQQNQPRVVKLTVSKSDSANDQGQRRKYFCYEFGVAQKSIRQFGAAEE
jgi:hypothetical protein